MIHLTKHNNHNVLQIKSTRIDSACAVEFKEQVIQAIDSGVHDFVLDLSEVDFIDSSGIGAIVGILKYLGQKGTLAITGLSQTVDRVFRLTRMDRVFRIYSSLDEALAAA